MARVAGDVPEHTRDQSAADLELVAEFGRDRAQPNSMKRLLVCNNTDAESH